MNHVFHNIVSFEQSQDLTDRKYKSESTIRELKSKLSSLEEEHLRAKQELQTLRKQNTTLDSEYHEQEKMINQMRTKLAVLEQEIKDKENLIAKSSDLLGSEQDQKVCLTAKLKYNFFVYVFVRRLKSEVYHDMCSNETT